jgi:hypothetical protein
MLYGFVRPLCSPAIRFMFPLPSPYLTIAALKLGSLKAKHAEHEGKLPGMAQVVVEHPPDGAQALLILLRPRAGVGLVHCGWLDVGTQYLPCVLEPDHYLGG